MAVVDLYRGKELYRSLNLPPGRYSYEIAHRQPLTLAHLEGVAEFALEMCDVIEHFVLDVPSGHYVSTNFLSLPPWVLQREMEQARRDDERKRIDTFARMFA